MPIAFGVRLPEAKMADAMIKDGEMDFWEVYRPFLADPERLRKTAPVLAACSACPVFSTISPTCAPSTRAWVVNAAGEETFLEADTVVAASPRKAEQNLLDSVEFMGAQQT